MYYYSTEDRKSKVAGAIAALVYVVVCTALMLLVTFRVDIKTQAQGIMLDIIGDPGSDGSAEVGGEIQVPIQPLEVSGEIATQDVEEAPAVVAQPVEKPQPKPQEKPRQADPNALFRPSASAQSGSGGSGAASAGNGTGRGGYGGDDKGTGGGGTGHDYSVGNRSLVGSLPLPSTNYGKNKQGKVVIEIYVDEEGAVTQARYRAEGSTTNDSELVRIATEAARKARFTRGGNDIPETGTITYTFSLK